MVHSSIHEALVTTTDRYIQEADEIFSDVESENKTALLDPENCVLLEQNLRYVHDIEEMQIIFNKDIICSSRGDRIDSQPIYLPTEELPSTLLIIPDPYSVTGASISVINKDILSKGYYAVSSIDKAYIRSSIGYRLDDRFKRAVIFIGEASAPVGQTKVGSNPQYIATSDLYQYEVLLEASDKFTSERKTFYFLLFIPITLVVYLTLYYAQYLFSHKRSMYTEVKLALKMREFFLHYQPHVDASSGRVFGVEALVRWQHPVRGVVYPDVFIPLMEEYGLMNELTDYVLDTAYHDLVGKGFIDGKHLGINVPPGYLSDKKSIYLLKQYKQKFDDIGVSLGLEITERQFLDDAACESISRLRASGVDILIDDFGTGQTSLSVLEQTNIDYLKIDKCFVDSIGHQSVNTPVLNAIINLANELDVGIIAEGVETDLQAQYLLTQGVTLHQGYLYAKPTLIDELYLSDGE
ncbi:EAL domain-containing protein (putative c-di-GMP-specific phosphodiesterase class I) [Photobacterium lutimaris]|nr:EAL domain-containing protein (putative c-di-GMP-specific phosphodiesterase class I) [Photobacterium lutimaris]